MTNFVRGALVCLLFAFPMSARAQISGTFDPLDTCKLIFELGSTPETSCIAMKCYLDEAQGRINVEKQAVAVLQFASGLASKSLAFECEADFAGDREDLPCNPAADAACRVQQSNDLMMKIKVIDSDLRETRSAFQACDVSNAFWGPSATAQSARDAFAAIINRAEASYGSLQDSLTKIRDNVPFQSSVKSNFPSDEEPCSFDPADFDASAFEIQDEAASLLEFYFRILGTVLVAANYLDDYGYDTLNGDCSLGFPGINALCNSYYQDYLFLTGQAPSAPSWRVAASDLGTARERVIEQSNQAASILGPMSPWTPSSSMPVFSSTIFCFFPGQTPQVQARISRITVVVGEIQAAQQGREVCFLIPSLNL